MRRRHRSRWPADAAPGGKVKLHHYQLSGRGSSSALLTSAATAGRSKSPETASERRPTNSGTCPRLLLETRSTATSAAPSAGFNRRTATQARAWWTCSSTAARAAASISPVRTGGTRRPRGPAIRATSPAPNDLRRTATGRTGGAIRSPLCRERAAGVGEIAARCARLTVAALCAATETSSPGWQRRTYRPRARTSPRASRRPPCRTAGRAHCRPAAASPCRTSRRPRPAPPWLRPHPPGGSCRPRLRDGARRPRQPVTKSPGSYTAPGASPQTGTRRFLRSAGSRPRDPREPLTVIHTRISTYGRSRKSRGPAPTALELP